MSATYYHNHMDAGSRVATAERKNSVRMLDPTACPGLVYYLLNKPPKVVTTAQDPAGRPTVVDLVPAEPRVFPVGRLDWDTEGILLLTNDGPIRHGADHRR